MPNHNNNQLTLASGEDLLSVLNPYLIEATSCGYTEYTFDFQTIIPMDEKLLEGEDWYDWRVKNWGTKWEGYGGRFNDDQTAFTFDTAWSPPTSHHKEAGRNYWTDFHSPIYGTRNVLLWRIYSNTRR